MLSGIYGAKIVSVTGASPGPRAAHKYTLDVNIRMPDGTPQILRIPDIMNCWGAWWEETTLNSIAGKPGNKCLAEYTATTDDSGYWEAYVRDGPEHGDCSP